MRCGCCSTIMFTNSRLIGGFLTLTLLAMLGLGAFAVGLSLQARQSIGLDPFRVGLLFTECGLVPQRPNPQVRTSWCVPTGEARGKQPKYFVLGKIYTR